MKNKAFWFAYAVGLKEDEEAVMRRNRLTRCTDVKETPKDKTGNRLDFFGFTRWARGISGSMIWNNKALIICENLTIIKVKF